MNSRTAQDKATIIATAMLWLSAYCALACLWFSINWVVQTLTYPFMLDFPEGCMLIEALRISQHLPIYAAPSLDYVPNLYTPFYFYLTGLLTMIAGPHMWVARLVSTVASAGIGAIIYTWVRREGGNRLLALTALGQFAGLGALIGRWYDMARPDCLYLFFFMAGAYIIFFHRTRISDYCAAVLLILAVYTKQICLLEIPPLLFALYLQSPKRALRIGVLTAVSVIAIGWWLNAASDGWFMFYTWHLGQTHQLLATVMVTLFPIDMAFMCMGILLAFRMLAGFFREDKKRFWLYGSLLAGMAGASLFGRMHTGGYVNVNLSAYIAIILVGTIGLARDQANESGTRYDARQTFRNYGLLVLQTMLCIVYGPSLLPTAKDVEGGAQLVDKIKAVHGDVLIPDFGMYQLYAGKTSYGWGSAGWDILRMQGESDVKRRFSDSINQALDERRFGAIILSSRTILPSPFVGNPHFTDHYCMNGNVYSDKRTFMFVGWIMRPQMIYVPCVK